MRTATPLRDLVDDHRAGQVGHLGADLDAAVHRAGVHDERVVAQASTRRAVRPKRVVYSRSDGTRCSVMRSRCMRSR